MIVGNKFDNEIFSKSIYCSFLFSRYLCSRTCSDDSLRYSRVFLYIFSELSADLGSSGNLIHDFLLQLVQLVKVVQNRDQ